MGPAPYLAGNVSEMACEVLRCGNPADSVLIVSPPGTPLMEAAVCQEHQSQIDQGDRWLYRYEEASGSRLLMGRDLPLRAVHVKVKSGFTCPGGMTRLFAVVLEDHEGSPRDVEFELPPEIADGIWRVLGRGREEPGPAPAPDEPGQD
jgi:hypothetical protein